MSLYSYTAVDETGKQTKGTVEADNQAAAMKMLKQNGQIPIKLAEAGAMSKDMELQLFQKKPKSRDMAVFCRQFVSIITAGVQVTRTLEMLAEQTENKLLAQAIAGCRLSIQGGMSLSDAMKDYPKVFSSLFVTMVAAGEISGSLDIAFARMGSHFEKEAKLKGLVQKASVYPAVVCVVAVLVVAMMLTFVIPTFEEMLLDLDVELPLLTLLVIAASQVMQKWWWLILLILGGLSIYLKHFHKTEAGQKLFGRILLKTPVFGKLTVKTACARMARTLSTLTVAGVPVMDALLITADTMSNVFFRDALRQSKESVSMGERIAQSLERSKLFPPLVYHMIGIGEETGNLDGMLTTLADYYDEEVEMTTQQVMALLEPLIIILLALVVGTIVMAVILPMGSMYTGLDNL